MESALGPPLPTATRALADIQIQARLTNGSGQNIIAWIRGSRRQVADIKSESRPASNRNRWPASYWNAWPASSESAILTLQNKIVGEGQSISAATFIASTWDYYPVTYYAFWDTPGGGHFTYNGVIQLQTNG